MTKVSALFLVGFSSVALAGAASAQGSLGGFSGSVQNSLSSQASGMGATAQTPLKLNAPVSEMGQLAKASSLSSADMISSLKGNGSGLPTATVKLGGGGTPGAAAAPSPFANVLSGGTMSLANALGSSGPSDGASDMKSVGAVGAGMGNFANALAGQPVAGQKLGK